MNNSIQYFLENGIPGLKKIVLDLGCHIISEVLEECNVLLEESLKRRLHWHVKDRGRKI